jgi:hypothetical protein|tara:strand:- start:5531 stop:5824 length:294 start_codon:yes stop_codon:yes gene_type:complete
MKITKDLLRTLIKEALNEQGFRLEKDFQPGQTVTWNVLAKVIKTTATGREKVDYERMTMTGEVAELLTSGGAVGGVAIVMDPDGNSHEIEVSELTLL